MIALYDEQIEFRLLFI